jgi:hypothetical protein
MPQRWESVKGQLRLLVLIIPALPGWPFVLILGRQAVRVLGPMLFRSGLAVHFV